MEEVAFSLHIDHSLQFDKSEEGTQMMFAKERMARNRWTESVCEALLAPYASPEERKKRIKGINKEDFFG